VKVQGKLNGHIIFDTVLMLFAKTIIRISPCLSKLQPAKVGAFLRHSIFARYIFSSYCIILF